MYKSQQSSYLIKVVPEILMRLLPSTSAQFMAEAVRNGAEGREENFGAFFESWLTEQNGYLEELIRVSNKTTETPPEGHEEGVLAPLLDRVTKHYEHYYRTKSRWAEHHILAMMNPSWRSSLEDAFLWIGGWRPSMAFQLLYSKSGLQIEADLAKLLQGVDVGNLGNLSLDQLSRVDALQARTIRQEREISEKLAKHQETVADTSMVELSHIATELIRANEGGEGVAGIDDNRVESELARKEEGLVEILRRADELRLNTLKDVVNMLTPFQAVHFLIAAAELHLRLHEWGKRRDATTQNGEYVR